MKRRYLLLGIALAVASLPPAAWAAELTYPTKPVTLVNPFPPGGTLDLHARAVASAIEPYLGRPMVVENKAGAAGAAGTQFVAASRPDGYTLLQGWTGLSLIPHVDVLLGRPSIFKREDFIPIARLTASPPLLVVHADAPWKTLGELIVEAKRRPNELKHSSGGLYGISDLPLEILKLAAGFQMRHVPFTGGAPALTALLGKNVEANICYPGVCLPQVRAGKIRPLVVFGAARLPDYPDVPTVKELGHEAQFYAWMGIMAPKGTPPEVVAKLRGALGKLVQDASYQAVMARIGETMAYLDAEEFARAWEAESQRMGEVLKHIVKK